MKNKAVLIICTVLILSLIFGCQRQEANPKKQDLMRVKSTQPANSKKIILLMIDSLIPQAIDNGIRKNDLPTLKYLIEHGQYYRDVVTSFPTMSVTIDSTLLTGTYPNDHRVPGLNWYSAEEKKVINYGTGPMEIFKQGINQVLTDALIDLNGKHLNPKVRTIFEDLPRHGLKSGSVNGLIYRGTADHTLTIPAWIHVPTSIPREVKVKGPDYLALGALSNPLHDKKKLAEGPRDRLGFNNDYSLDTVKYLIKNNKLPDFLYVYLPDLDQKLHKRGPSEKKGVKQVDGQINDLLKAFGSREEALRKAVFILVGDSGVTQIHEDERNPVIDLHTFFEGYDVLRPGETVSEETDVILTVNETMAYVYKLMKDESLRNLAERLTDDPRIDFIAWKERGWMHALQGKTAKELRFKEKGNVVDDYEQAWTIEKDEDALDLKIHNGALEYGRYPDVLKRLHGALYSHPGDFLIVAAKPGYELADRSSPTHEGGGGHGSLSKEESLVPMIICGTKKRPEHLRLVDVKPFLLELLRQSGNGPHSK